MFAQYKVYFYIALVIAIFGSGLYLGHTYTKNAYEAKAAEQMRTAIEKANKQAKIDLDNAVKANQILSDIQLAGAKSKVKIKVVLAAHPEVRDMPLPKDVADAINELNGSKSTKIESNKVQEVIQRIRRERK